MSGERDYRGRRSIRLKGYDYALPGAYFVTICMQKRECFLGEIPIRASPCAYPEMHLNNAGQIIATIWRQIPDHYLGIDIDEFMIMPNHVHGIIIVGAGPCACPENARFEEGQPPVVAPTGLSLPDIVHRFKTMTTKQYTDGAKQFGWPPFQGRLWQRNYYEHIVRDEEELDRVRRYIRDNPSRWDSDSENPLRLKAREQA